MIGAGSRDSALRALVQAIVVGDTTAAARMLVTSPELAREPAGEGATRQTAKAHYLKEIEHYLYAGDTALHIAAAAYQKHIAMDLISKGADVRARNRRGAEPLHYAVDGAPGSRTWKPHAQGATIVCLIAAGADPNAVDNSGVTPLHRAVRTRCASAVRALLAGGADVHRTNKRGSTPLLLAIQNTGRGGTGKPEAKAEQVEILRLLKEYGVT
jgi:Ankyrin repeats (many copies)